jgi:phage terminase small subunit
MPSGGRRPGAGRPRKHPKLASDAPKAVPHPWESPLEYMLRVMRDPTESMEARARMAVAAAPYCHPKMGEQGKKDSKQEKAKAIASKFTPSTPPPKRH